MLYDSGYFFLLLSVKLKKTLLNSCKFHTETPKSEDFFDENVKFLSFTCSNSEICYLNSSINFKSFPKLNDPENPLTGLV